MTTQLAPPIQAGASLSYDGKQIHLPLVRGSENETAIDIEKLRAQTGLITLDPGYGN
jgi:citrate synthase